MKLPPIQLYVWLSHAEFRSGHEAVHRGNLFHEYEPVHRQEPMRDTAWEVIETANVHNNTRIRCPPPIKEQVVFDHSVYGDSVHWGYDTDTNVLVVSAVKLDHDRYSSAETSRLHERQNTITPPSELLDTLEENLRHTGGFFDVGSTVVYLATGIMSETEPYAYYLMRAARLFEMLDEDGTDESSLVRVLSKKTPY